MCADIAKSPLGYLAEFHCHTRRSHDGFTSEEELLYACRTKGIGLLTITEHDRLPVIDVQRFATAGIYVTRGASLRAHAVATSLGCSSGTPLTPAARRGRSSRISGLRAD